MSQLRARFSLYRPAFSLEVDLHHPAVASPHCLAHPAQARPPV